MGINLSRSMNRKSENELYAILNNTEQYQESAILDAISELEERGANIEKYINLRNNIISTQNTRNQMHKKRFNVPDDLPDSIRKASHLIYLGIIIGILSLIASEHFFDAGIFSTIQGFLTVVISILITGILAYFILLGRVVARTLFIILFVTGILSTMPAVIFLFHAKPVIGVFSIFQLVIQLSALFLLHKKESNEWYKKQHNLMVVN